MKQFDLAIIDESYQIVKPQLLNIHCAQTPQGKKGIEKFILIGDHKQLPAVVLQSSVHSEIYDEELRSIGVTNLQNSLFERLHHSLRTSASDIYPQVCDMLHRQGRMHPDVAQFPNEFFYGGKLEAVGLEHQTESSDNCVRVKFYPSEAEPTGSATKINQSEAAIAAQLAKQGYEQASK